MVPQDDVVLTAAERSVLAELVARMPAEDAWLAAQLVPLGARTPQQRKPRSSTVALLALVAVVSVVVAGLLAVAARGDVAWSAWLVWAWATPTAFWLVLSKSHFRPKTRPSIGAARWN